MPASASWAKFEPSTLVVSVLPRIPETPTPKPFDQPLATTAPAPPAPLPKRASKVCQPPSTPPVMVKVPPLLAVVAAELFRTMVLPILMYATSSMFSPKDTCVPFGMKI